MRDLNYQLKQLCKRNRDGSYSTQANRARMLNQIANQLQEMGYRRMTTRSLKPKHVDALVKRWLGEGMAAGTIKNRMNCLRWWAAKVDRRNVIARSNEFYGIPDRQFVSNESKAVAVDSQALSSIQDDHVRMSLELQRAFGLRREEAIKFMPGFADQGDHIRLKAAWTKGGKARVVLTPRLHARLEQLELGRCQHCRIKALDVCRGDALARELLNARRQVRLVGGNHRAIGHAVLDLITRAINLRRGLLIGPGLGHLDLPPDPHRRVNGLENADAPGWHRELKTVYARLLDDVAQLRDVLFNLHHAGHRLRKRLPEGPEYVRRLIEAQADGLG